MNFPEPPHNSDAITREKLEQIKLFLFLLTLTVCGSGYRVGVRHVGVREHHPKRRQGEFHDGGRRRHGEAVPVRQVREGVPLRHRGAPGELHHLVGGGGGARPGPGARGPGGAPLQALLQVVRVPALRRRRGVPRRQREQGQRPHALLPRGLGRRVVRGHLQEPDGQGQDGHPPLPRRAGLLLAAAAQVQQRHGHHARHRQREEDGLQLRRQEQGRDGHAADQGRHVQRHRHRRRHGAAGSLRRRQVPAAQGAVQGRRGARAGAGAVVQEEEGRSRRG